MSKSYDKGSAVNNWSQLSGAYNATRRGYPDELYAYLKTLVRAGRATLDLGCGTGISSRELLAHGFSVTGVDRDEAMLAVARSAESQGEIHYVQAPISELPFTSGSYDIVTAFTAFHWFDDDASVESFKKVLKPGGLFFAALKENRKDPRTATLAKECHAILKKYAGKDYNSAGNYEPRTVLSRHSFTDICEKDFPVDEFYTVDDALKLITSLSFWNLVSDENKPKMLAELRQVYEANLIDGKVLRTRVIQTIAGYK